MKWILIFVFAIIAIITTESFDTPGLLPNLSAYHIYTGNPADLVPTRDFVNYQLATPLFTDYAEKQRLIKLPQGQTLKITGDGLPEFPDGTILAKTFFYWQDKRDTAKGKHLVETRLLIKQNGSWQTGAYVWNAGQTDATLTTSGQRLAINWTNENGMAKKINYPVPTDKQCATCHYSNKQVIPIGFKIRNLNIPVTRNNRTLNQLQYFASLGIAGKVDPSAYTSLPAWNDSTRSLEQRAKAYLDVNCAHCHNENGYCARSDFRAGYENPINPGMSKSIINYMRSGRMPLLGTTVVHKEGLQLVSDYLTKQ